MFCEPVIDGRYIYIGVQRFKGVFCGFNLWPAHSLSAVGYLTLEIAEIHDIVIYDAYSADPCGCQVVTDRRTETSGAYHKHL